jgi:5-methylcytosine-specific restriction endonuclease McrA
MYLNEYERIRRENDLNETYYKENDFFAEIEDELCSAKIKSNVSVTFSIRVIKQYTSPQGRNHYEDYRNYSADQLLAAMARVKVQQDHKKETTAKRNAERAKMSETLRYDVLKRDGFRCRLCGLSADDGVKLHVDHIKPVSKGGKTELNNLRTLCDRCNFGKGDKYDPNGKN